MTLEYETGHLRCGNSITSAHPFSVFSFGMCLLVVYVFLFIGFNAFTDPNDFISGFINSGVAFGVALGAHYAFAKDGNEEDVKDADESTATAS